MDTFYIGQIFMGGWNFAPRGSALCNGLLMPIAQNQALFSLLGAAYGGDGRTTFALPDLRGRVPVGSGNGPGLTTRPLGQKGGAEEVTLNILDLPSHTHSINTPVNIAISEHTVTGDVTIQVSDNIGNAVGAHNNALALAPVDSSGDRLKIYDKAPTFAGDKSLKGVKFNLKTPEVNLSPNLVGSTEATGNDQAHYNMQPYTVINYCIALEGTFPSRT